MTSKKHFEKVKAVFGVDNETELKNKLLKVKATSTERIRYGGGGFNDVPFIYDLVNPETIGIYR